MIYLWAYILFSHIYLKRIILLTPLPTSNIPFSICSQTLEWITSTFQVHPFIFSFSPDSSDVWLLPWLLSLYFFRMQISFLKQIHIKSLSSMCNPFPQPLKSQSYKLGPSCPLKILSLFLFPTRNHTPPICFFCKKMSMSLNTSQWLSECPEHLGTYWKCKFSSPTPTSWMLTWVGWSEAGSGFRVSIITVGFLPKHSWAQAFPKALSSTCGMLEVLYSIPERSFPQLPHLWLDFLSSTSFS